MSPEAFRAKNLNFAPRRLSSSPLSSLPLGHLARPGGQVFWSKSSLWSAIWAIIAIDLALQLDHGSWNMDHGSQSRSPKSKPKPRQFVKLHKSAFIYLGKGVVFGFLPSPSPFPFPLRRRSIDYLFSQINMHSKLASLGRGKLIWGFAVAVFQLQFFLCLPFFPALYLPAVIEWPSRRWADDAARLSYR